MSVQDPNLFLQTLFLSLPVDFTDLLWGHALPAVGQDSWTLCWGFTFSLGSLWSLCQEVRGHHVPHLCQLLSLSPQSLLLILLHPLLSLQREVRCYLDLSSQRYMVPLGFQNEISVMKYSFTHSHVISNPCWCILTSYWIKIAFWGDNGRLTLFTVLFCSIENSSVNILQ